MKKLSFIFAILLVFFVACKTNSDEPKQTLSDPDGIAYKNNATDNMFDVSGTPSFTENKVNYYRGFNRLSGNAGIIGKWKRTEDSMITEVSFNSDGTFTYHKESDTTISNKSGTFELYVDDTFYNLHIKYNNGNEYKMKYVCSERYFCTEEYQSYSGI